MTAPSEIAAEIAALNARRSWHLDEVVAIERRLEQLGAPHLASEGIPAGWVPFSEAPRALGLSSGAIRNRVYRGTLEVRCFGIKRAIRMPHP